MLLPFLLGRVTLTSSNCDGAVAGLGRRSAMFGTSHEQTLVSQSNSVCIISVWHPSVKWWFSCFCKDFLRASTLVVSHARYIPAHLYILRQRHGGNAMDVFGQHHPLLLVKSLAIRSTQTQHPNAIRSFTVIFYYMFRPLISPSSGHSFSSLSQDRSTASSKASCPHSAI
jgi:hypothetical protein